MKCLIPLFILFLFSASSIAFAENDSITTWPYKISFDLGIPRDNYKVTVNPPKEGKSRDGEKITLYGMSIEGQTPGVRAGIGLNNYFDEQATPTSDEWAQILKEKANDLKLSDEEIATRTVDNTIAGTVSGNLNSKKFGSLKIYEAIYYSPIDPKHLQIIVTSSFPWEGGTSNLLNTIHVEKVN